MPVASLDTSLPASPTLPRLTAAPPIQNRRPPTSSAETSGAPFSCVATPHQRPITATPAIARRMTFTCRLRLDGRHVATRQLQVLADDVPPDRWVDTLVDSGCFRPKYRWSLVSTPRLRWGQTSERQTLLIFFRARRTCVASLSTMCQMFSANLNSRRWKVTHATASRTSDTTAVGSRSTGGGLFISSTAR